MFAISFEELPGFTKEVVRLLDDDSYAALQFALVQNPEQGKLVVASGGLRKLRWALPGRGKSGGVRVIYFWWVSLTKVIFCKVYPKNEKENLTPREIAELRKEVENLIRQEGQP